MCIHPTVDCVAIQKSELSSHDSKIINLSAKMKKNLHGSKARKRRNTEQQAYLLMMQLPWEVTGASSGLHV